MSIKLRLQNFCTHVPAVLSAASMLLFSCRQPDQKPAAATHPAPDSPTSAIRDTSTKRVAASSRRDTMINTPSRDSSAAASAAPDTSVTASGITDPQEFWRQLKRAVKNKNNAAIIDLTYFPFYNNSSPDSKADWKEEIPDDIFKLSKRKAPPVFLGEETFGGTDYKTNEESSITVDSVFVISIPGGMIYFGKIQGSYKLVSKLNPG